MPAAATTTDVTALSARARQDRVAAGQVELAGIILHDGNTAGAGDWILTRRNDRRLRTSASADWVKNGDAWLVTGRHPDGSLTARRLGRGGTIWLPAAYVAADVELLYATTTNRAQGATVDTAHPLVIPGMSREHLYVAAIRARHHTTIYVVTHDLPALDPDDQLDRAATDRRMWAAREVLTAILGRETAGKSATQAIRDTLAEQLSQAPGYPQLRRALLAGEQAGVHPARLLASAAANLGPNPDQLSADQLAAQLTGHIAGQVLDAITSHTKAGSEPAWLAVPASATSAASHDIPGYLRDLQDVITARIGALTEIAAATRRSGYRPSATRLPGPSPSPDGRPASPSSPHGATSMPSPPASLPMSSAPGPSPKTIAEPAWQHAFAAVTTGRGLSASDTTPPPEPAREAPADPPRALREAAHAARRDRAAKGLEAHRRDDIARVRAPRDGRQPQDQQPRLVPPPQQPQQGRPITW